MAHVRSSHFSVINYSWTFSYFPPYFISVFSGLNHLISCCSATIVSHFEPFGIFLINIIHLRWQKISLMKLTFNNIYSFMMKFKSPIRLASFSLRFITFECVHNTTSVVDLVRAGMSVHTLTCAVHVGLQATVLISLKCPLRQITTLKLSVHSAKARSESPCN